MINPSNNKKILQLSFLCFLFAKCPMSKCKTNITSFRIIMSTWRTLCNHESHISLRIWIVLSSLTKRFRYTMLLKMISVVYRKPLVGDGGIVYKLINFQTQDSDNVHTGKNLYDFVWMRLIYVAYKWLTYSNLKISFISFFLSKNTIIYGSKTFYVFKWNKKKYCDVVSVML